MKKSFLIYLQMESQQFGYQPNFLPDKSNENIKRLISLLDIDNDPFYLDIMPDDDAEFGACFPNVLRKVEKEKGKIVYGWQFFEHSYMIEAEFHAIWKSPSGKYIDITKRGVKDYSKSLFVIDTKRKFDGTAIDNMRINTTKNEFVDDIIKAEKAKFRFLNKGDRAKTIGLLSLNKEETAEWNELNGYIILFDELRPLNYTIHSPCYCNSGYIYDRCHRNIFKRFISAI